MTAQMIVGVRDELSPDRPSMLSLTCFGVATAGKGWVPSWRTRLLFTMSRWAAEYFGLHVVSVSVARLVPGCVGSGVESSTSTSLGSTTSWDVTW